MTQEEGGLGPDDSILVLLPHADPRHGRAFEPAELCVAPVERHGARTGEWSFSAGYATANRHIRTHGLLGSRAAAVAAALASLDVVDCARPDDEEEAGELARIRKWIADRRADLAPACAEASAGQAGSKGAAA